MTMAISLRKEWTAMIRDGRSVALLAALAMLLAGMLLAAMQRHDAQSRERAAIAEGTRQQWNAQGDKHPHRGAHFGLYAFRPDNVLAALDPGLTPYVGRALWLEPHRRNMTRFEPAADAPPGERFGRLDVAFVLSTLVPLLIVALAFDAVSRERESGTLRMLHGAGLSPAVLLASKLTVLLAAFAVVAAMPVLAALAAGSSADVIARAAALSAGYLLLFAICVAMALAVSAASPGSRTALIWLIGVWLAVSLVVPRAAAAVANHAEPLPSATAFWAAIQHDYEQGLPGDGDLAERGRRVDAQLLQRFGVQRLQDLPMGAAPLRRLARDAYADRVHAMHFDRLWASYARHRQWMQIASLLSPTLAMQSLSMTLAGTDLAHQRHFEDSAEAYRRDVNTAIDSWDATHTRGFTSFEEKYAGEALWRGIAPFDYAPPELGFALRTALPELAVLLLWTALAAGLLGASVRRLSP
ncbi:DUF3526 domain-containing protein [Paracidovorax citrulli]